MQSLSRASRVCKLAVISVRFVETCLKPDGAYRRFGKITEIIANVAPESRKNRR